jgi:hypothetical protein
MMKRASLLLLLAPILIGAPFAAAAAADLPQRTINLVVYGDDPCPRGDPDEIVVCARKPDNERYRIPKALRNRKRDEPGGTSWASQWAGMEDQIRYTRPNSCSAVGSGGQTGCFQSMIRQWYVERQMLKDEAASAP